MLQGPGMHAISIGNNEIRQCEPWKRCLVRAFGGEILTKIPRTEVGLKKLKKPKKAWKTWRTGE